MSLARLAAADAQQAFAAMCDSVAAPTQAVALLNQHLQPAPALEVEKVQQLIAHLDDGNFKVREKSDGGLAAVGRARCAIARQGVGRQAELGGATRGADRGETAGVSGN